MKNQNTIVKNNVTFTGFKTVGTPGFCFEKHVKDEKDTKFVALLRVNFKSKHKTYIVTFKIKTVLSHCKGVQ